MRSGIHEKVAAAEPSEIEKIIEEDLSSNATCH